MDKKTTVNQLRQVVARFVRERDWEQFHSPKNLSMAIAIEAAELMEHFQWDKAGEDVTKLIKTKTQIEQELADILAFILSFSSMYKIDLTKALLKKIKQNEKKYPTKMVKGKAHKYTFYKKGRR